MNDKEYVMLMLVRLSPIHASSVPGLVESHEIATFQFLQNLHLRFVHIARGRDSLWKYLSAPRSGRKGQVKWC